jgi:topoisomerase-4 subunit A
MRGSAVDPATLSFKSADALSFLVPTDTHAKLIFLASDGRAFTLDAAKLPTGRGFGEPLRLMVDLDASARLIAVFPFIAERQHLLIAGNGRGFITRAEDLLGATRKGRAVFSVGEAMLNLAIRVSGDHLAMIGENRRLVVFPLAEVPILARGSGVRLQRYREGGVSDAKTFTLTDGLTWRDGAGRAFALRGEALSPYLGHRADPGRPAPRGFPKSGMFGS